MIFYSSTAPTSWTKEVNATYDNRALRVIGGADGTALSPSGTSPFTSVFASNKFISQNVTQAPANITVPTLLGPAYITVVATGSNFAMQAEGLTNAQTITHRHPYPRKPGVLQPAQGAATDRYPQNTLPTTVGTNPAGGGGQHNHGITDGQHGHPIASGGQHSHTLTIAQHSHTFTTTARDFSLAYIDIIVAQKD
jgi:hypothetical protein